MKCPRYRVEKHQLNRAAVVTVTPLGSRITVFPRGLAHEPCVCVYLVCMELIRGAQPRSDCLMLCVDLLVSRSTDGDGRDILSRTASCSSCFLHRSSRCLQVVDYRCLVLIRSSPRSPDGGPQLTYEKRRNYHVTPGRSVWFPKVSMASPTHGVEPWSLCCCQTSRASWVRGNDAREPLHENHDSTRVRVVKSHRTTCRERMDGRQRNPI